MNQSTGFQLVSERPQTGREPQVIDNPDDQHAHAEDDEREPEVPRRRGMGSVPVSRSFWKNWKIVKPNPISDSEVGITDINVRSALFACAS